jgi:TRAP transporter TAXI family solute receptor
LIDHVVKTYTYVTAESIPIDYYPELENEGPVATVGASTVLFTHEDMSEETVYRMVKAVMTNLELFRKQHPAFRDLVEEEMAQIPDIPIHPGAERYFREAGLLP